MLSLLASFSVSAQFKLTGNIVNYKGTEKLVVNVPVVYGFYHENSIQVPISKDGYFEILLPIKERKFANLIFQRHFNTLLLKPKKDLNITINERDRTVKIISGTAFAENKLMQEIDLEEYPFFFAEQTKNKYANLSLSALKKEVIFPYDQQREEKIAKVEKSTLSINDKLAIKTEINAIAYNYLNDFARTSLPNKKIVDSLIVTIFDGSDKHPMVLPAGPQYFSFIRNYVGYLETKAFIKVKPDQLSTNEIIPYFGLTLDSATKIIKSFGKPYWRWIGASKNLPPSAVEPYIYQEILNLYNTKDLKSMEGLANAFQTSFTKSAYNADITQKINTLRKILIANETNSNIKIFTGYEKTTSIYDIVKTLKGKVVYLDVWGTWCGPCKEELKHNPELKAHFTGKDVAFVYLDMDDEDEDTAWREFIKVNGLTGLHLRKNRQTIQSFWPELLAKTDDKAEYYPQYFIFDKGGNLVVSKAKRPSDQNELYDQLEKYLVK